MKPAAVFLPLALGMALAACRTAPPPPPPAEPAPAPSASASDEVLHDRVHAALERAPGLDASRIRVVVRNSNVYLSGSVRTQKERDIAHEVAHSVEGVSRVYGDDLRVQ